MSKFSIFQRSVLLSAPPSEVYAFHEDPRNITKISPPSLQVIEVDCMVPAQVGEEFYIKVRQCGLKLEWVGFWEAAEPNCKLIDGAKKSPFRHWRHQHLFDVAGSQGEQTLMTDRVEYSLQAGVFGILGRLLDVTVMRVVFTLMFHARHRATRKYFTKSA